MLEATPDLVRCPSCGAANAPDAEWCGQCLHRFGSEPDAASRPSAAVVGDGTALAWTCPVCDASNPMDAIACATCGTSIAVAFGGKERGRRRRTSPGGAVALSAALPGLGHWSFGDLGSAAARAILYLWSLGIAVLLLARPPDSARGLVRGIGALFALSAAAVWLLAMVETLRLNNGDERPVVPRNALMWFSAALSMVLAVGLLGAAIAGGR